jgi:hypothetical protein
MNRIALSFIAIAFSTLAVAQSPADQQARQLNKLNRIAKELQGVVDSLNMINGVVAPATTGTTPSSVVTRPSRVVSRPSVRKPASSTAPKAKTAAPKASESVGGAYDHHDEKLWNFGIDIGYVWNQSDYGTDNTDRSHPEIDERNDGTDFGFDINLQRSFGKEGPYRNMWFVEVAYMYNRHSGIFPGGDGYGGTEAARALTQKSYYGNAHSIYAKAGANLLQLMDFVTDEVHESWSMDFQTGLGILFNNGNRVFGSGDDQVFLKQWNTRNLVVPIELELVHTLNDKWAISGEFYTVYIPGDFYDAYVNEGRDAIWYVSVGVRRHFDWF